jgi:hypothetical protein
MIFAQCFGSIICVISVISVIILIPIDNNTNKIIKHQKLLNIMNINNNEDNNEISIVKSQSIERRISSDIHRTISFDLNNNNDNIDVNEPNKTEEVSIKECFNFSFIFWILVILCVLVYGVIAPFNYIASTFLLERDYFKSVSSDCILEHSGCQSDINLPTCTVGNNYAPPLPYNLTTIDNIYYSQVTSDIIDCTVSYWKDTCTIDYCSKLEKARSLTAVIMSIPYFISGIASPFVGIAVDIYGLRPFVSLVATIIILIVHLSLGFTNVNPIYPLIGQGTAYTAFACVLWPSVPLVIEERSTGLAFGIVTSSLNMGCAIIPLVVAFLYNQDNNHYIPNIPIFFATLGGIGTILAIYLNYYDYYYLNNMLNQSEEEAKKSIAYSKINIINEDYKNIMI